MADLYTYTLNGQLSGTGGASARPISGNFSVDYDTFQIYNSNISINGVVFNGGILQNYRNSDGSTGYRASFLSSPSSNDTNTLEFVYDQKLENSLTGVRYIRIFTDYSTGSPVRTFTDLQSSAVPANSVAVCFCTGTNICIVRHGALVNVAVEDLQVGDHAVTVSGALRPITWIGHRNLDGAGTVLPHDQQPIRIRASAFGPGLPARDLSLSPGHPVLVGAGADGEGGHLVPVMCLINGTTITREPATSVTYWHVELDSHDILLAEGLPAESYLDWGDRPFFTEASDHALHNPDFVVPGLAARCRPVAVDGPVVEAERARLSGVFAAALGADCAWDQSGRFDWIAA
ncbi:hypothetical protein MPEAHAMD_3848 [Methylobacterium frigidaeris]|uniref:Hedgehog/Intein (Hint) domain-containing protein n=1 Tax=Methylobacterium frigidaeris TaxID=2038277 RepID=A0AA37HDA9_9HYPH|nr:hypothetical protein MPEAHAMD_3848 [Methylobacterium frigidaeris]